MGLEDLGILEVLQDMDQGHFVESLDEDFRKEAQLVKERGGEAVLNIKIVIKATSPMDPQLEVAAQITTKDPLRTSRSSFVYYHKNQFSRSDPRQMPLPLGRDIREDRETRDINRGFQSREVGGD